MKTKMKTTLLLCLFLLLLFLIAHADASGETAQEFKLKCQEGTVEVRVGQNVTLNCKSEPQRDLTEEIISWIFNSAIVLNFRDRKMSPYQDVQFKGRVHNLSDWDTSEGKLSVEISSVNENDTGVYTCSVLHRPNCTVTLIVKKTAPNDNSTGNPAEARDDDTPPPPPSGDSNNCTGIGIGVGVVGIGVGAAIGALVTWLICRKRRTQKPSQESIELPSTTKNEEADPLTAPSPNAEE